MNKGKAYANRKPKSERPKGDFYSTPKSLVWAAEDIIKYEFSIFDFILEPCAGHGAISKELEKMRMDVVTMIYINLVMSLIVIISKLNGLRILQLYQIHLFHCGMHLC